MDQDLDSVLGTSAPELAERTDDVLRDLYLVVADAETIAFPHKRRMTQRLGLVGLAAAGVLGLGVAASASGLVDTPWSNAASKTFSYPGPFVHADELEHVGTDCKVVFGASETEELEHPVSKTDRYEALQHAKQFILNFDISTIPVADAEARYREEYAAMRASMGPQDPDRPASQLTPEGSPGEIKAWALLGELDRRLQADLKAHGLSTHAVSAVAMPECTEHAQLPDLDEHFEGSR